MHITTRLKPPTPLAALAAPVLAASLTLGLAPGSVGAAEAGQAAAKPRHNLRVDAKEIGDTDRFVLYGKVLTFPRGEIVLERSVAGGDFTRLKKLKTRRTGSFRARIFQVPDKLTCFKVVVPADHDHRRTVSKGASCITG